MQDFALRLFHFLAIALCSGKGFEFGEIGHAYDNVSMKCAEKVTVQKF